MTANRDFKGVWIPRRVWLDERLSMLDKGILIEIDSLDNGDEGCFASNEHLATFCQCSERKVSESISRLVSLGYVKVAMFDGRKRFLRSCLEKTARQPSKNCEADSQNLRGRLEKSARQTRRNCEADSQNLRDSNTSNNTPNNPTMCVSRKRFTPPTLDEVRAYAKEKGYDDFNADKWYSYHESNGWKVGRNPMKDWRAAVRYWHSRDGQQRQNPALQYQQREEHDDSGLFVNLEDYFGGETT